jgi:hypothetical protein
MMLCVGVAAILYNCYYVNIAWGWFFVARFLGCEEYSALDFAVGGSCLSFLAALEMTAARRQKTMGCSRAGKKRDAKKQRKGRRGMVFVM